MNDVNRELGETLAEALGEGPSRRALAAQRATLLLRWSAQRGRARRLPWGSIGLGAAAVCAMLLFVLWRHTAQQAPVTWQGAPIAENQLLHADDGPGRLEFANGSLIELRAASSAVVGQGPSRVEVALQRGQLDADVQRVPGTEWIVSAGPYRVRVVGTRFSVAWQPQDTSFTVEVTRGEVRVSGGDLPAEGVALRAGARLQRTGAAGASLEPKVAEAPPVEAPSPEPPDPDASEERDASEGPVAGVAPRGRGTAPVAPSSQGAAWRQLASEGRYEDAVAAVSPSDFQRLLATGGPADLLLLGNTARFAGQPDRARRAYTSLRSRFSQTPEARLAAFSLARLSADVDRNPQKAIHWLRVFLRESPSGDLAASARARLMDTLASQGDRRGAAEVARDYLRYHPRGPHSGVARSLLGSPSRP